MALTDPLDNAPELRPWAAFVPAVGRATLAALRTAPGLTACETAAGLWVRGNPLDDGRNTDAADRLRTEVAAEMFEVLAEDELVPYGCRVPTARLPNGPWRPLRELLAVQWPAAGFSALRPAAFRPALVPTDAEREPAALELNVLTWSRFVVTAPLVRLSRWEFAASVTGSVLVRGAPLPSLPGTRYTDRDGVLVPVGSRWDPEVSPRLVRRALNVSSDELVLWRANGVWQRIPTDAFVPARRANVRQTALELAAGGGDA